jgi:hypothetical protein
MVFEGKMSGTMQCTNPEHNFFDKKRMLSAELKASFGGTAFRERPAKIKCEVQGFLQFYRN